MEKQHNGGSKTPKSPDRSNKDVLLIVVLFFFNVWSGATTIIGASQILPSHLAFLSGIAIQSMLFLLLAGWVMKHSFVRKWLAIFAFSAFSVYTSFFCYYNILTDSVRLRDIRTQSVEAHQQLVATVFTPIVEKDRQLNELYEELKRKAEEECKSGLTTGITGCGPVARDFQKQSIELNSQRQSSKKLIENLSSKFNYNLDGLNSEEIYIKDVEALSAVPSQYKPKEFQIRREEYLPKIYDVNFLTPYYKVFESKNREDSAVFAMIIAMCVDGIAIIQGTAIEKRIRRYGIIHSATIKLSGFVRDLKTLWFEVESAVKQKPRRIDQYTEINKFILEANRYVSNLPSDLVNVFVVVLTSSISSSAPHRIDINRLQNNDYSYRLKERYSQIFSVFDEIIYLLDQNHFLDYDKNETNELLKWSVREDRYTDLISWLNAIEIRNDQANFSDISDFPDANNKSTIDPKIHRNNFSSGDGWEGTISDFQKF